MHVFAVRLMSLLCILEGGPFTYSDVMCEMLVKIIALGAQIACWVLYELGTAAEECLAAVLAHTVPVRIS